jgi:hypothetical protein
MTKQQADQIDAGNALAARLILADPEKYDGLPLEWAMLWQSRHPHVRLVECEPKPKTIEERLAAHDAKQRKKRIAKRRERWRQRQWRISRKGNRYVNVNDFHIVVFQREDRWMIRIAINKAKNHVSRKKRTTLGKRPWPEHLMPYCTWNHDGPYWSRSLPGTKGGPHDYSLQR